MKSCCAWALNFFAAGAIAGCALFGATQVRAASDTSPHPLVSELRSDETVVFYPTLGTAATNGGWNIRLHGCVYEIEKRRLTLATVRAALRLDGIKMNASELATFKERARLLFVDNQRNHRVVAQVAGQTFDLGESAANGHFARDIQVTNIAPGTLSLEISAVLPAGDTRKFSGVVMLLPASGISVVSDIDDTIKVSDVRNRDALVRRTFLQPFESVAGMAEVYRAWAGQGATFHYVTASPWQLHLPLLEFTGTNCFPSGTWQMKLWRLKDQTRDSIFENPERYKIESIAPLLREFPLRKFVLVGDSGERDPEAYASLAREFPTQVKAIFIRDVTGQGRDDARYRTNFAGLPPDLWRIFEKPAEITSLLPP